MLNEASRVLYNAMDEKVYFSDAIVVVPPDWSNSKCKEQIQTPMSDLVFRVRFLQFKTMYYLYIGILQQSIPRLAGFSITFCFW